MAGFRSRESYVAKYGEKDGDARYERLIKERDMRDKRKEGGKSITATIDLSTPEAQQTAVDTGNAVRCLECGYVGTRLQHTHFKHKCSGKVKNGEEYKALHPGALVVSPNLAKNTGGTLANYIKLYGEEEGQKRWNIYKGKQADSNGFEYKQEKHGWTKERYDAYNATRASTQENFVNRHGEEAGTAKWEQYCDRQRETMFIEHFVEVYGEEAGIKKFNAFNIARGLSGGNNQSNTEFDCFKVFRRVCPSLQHRYDIVTETHGYAFDFGCGYNKKLIEFYGTYWHVDPVKYGDDGTSSSGVPLEVIQTIRKRDTAKVAGAEAEGYEVMIVWEREWTKNPQLVVQKLRDWWSTPNPNAVKTVKEDEFELE